MLHIIAETAVWYEVGGREGGVMDVVVVASAWLVGFLLMTNDLR